MFIKTVSTASGINPIKFDETGGVFYWILNTGSSTIYASTRATFSAGDDGVFSLGPKESRRLETNNDTIYILGEGQVEIHNQRDGICSFKQAPTSSGGGGVIDAYTKTESDAKYAQKTDIPTSLPANGGNADYATNAGNADTVNGRHAYRIPTLDANANLFDANAENINDAYLQWDGSKYFKLRTFGENLTAVDHATNADTVDNLHADDFVNVNDRSQIQIPNNVDVPVWIHANGKRFQRYTTNGNNTGLANVPDNSTDYVWYWYDGMNIIARVYAVGKYYICDMINGNFSGWKDVYTSRNKPYVTGVVVVDSNGKANVSFGFDPSFVLYEPTSPKSGIFGSVFSALTFNATGFTPSADTYTGGLTGNGISYISFK